MLNSLFKRSLNKIKVNRIIKVDRSEKILLTEDKEVLNKIRSYFMKQFWKKILIRRDYLQAKLKHIAQLKI